MPTKLLPEFISRLEAMERKVEQHLVEGIGVKTDIATLKTDVAWIKKAGWVIAGAFVTGAFSLAVNVIKSLMK